MKVQPCPACGARYDARRLDDGVTFQCRRCGAAVVVGAAGPRGGASPGLAVAGFLLIAATFLFANPGFGEKTRWPWEQFQVQETAVVKATYLVWTAAGVWALLASLVPARRVRAAVAVGLATALLMLTTGRHAGFRLETMRLPEMVGAALLGAGFLVAGDDARRRAGRVLAFTGGLLLLAWPALHFPDTGEVSRLRILGEELWAAITRREEGAPRGTHLWEVLLPIWLVLGAAVMGLVTGLGFARRTWTLVGFLVLVAGFLLPTLSALVDDFDALQGGEEVRRLALSTLVAHGLALWALGTFAVAELVPSAPPGERAFA